MTDANVTPMGPKQSLFTVLLELKEASSALSYLVGTLPDGSGDEEENFSYVVGLASDRIADIHDRLMKAGFELPNDPD